MRFNAPLAREVLVQIENNPEEWDQGYWRCETGMCFAGWAVELAPGVRYICPPGDPEYSELVAVDLDVYPELRGIAISIRAYLIARDHPYDDPSDVAESVEAEFQLMCTFPGITLDTPVMQVSVLAGHLLGVGAAASFWSPDRHRRSPESERDIFAGDNDLGALREIVAEYEAVQG